MSLKRKKLHKNINTGQDRLVKKAIKKFKSRIDPQYIEHINYRKEFEIASYLSSKGVSSEIMWKTSRFIKFMRSREFSEECLRLNMLPLIKTEKITHIFTEFIPKFLKNFQYNGKNLEEYPIYSGENLLKLADCAYFMGMPSRQVLDLMKNTPFPFYYFSFSRINLKKDVINTNLLRFRLPELFFWIDNLYDELEKGQNG